MASWRVPSSHLQPLTGAELIKNIDLLTKSTESPAAAAAASVHAQYAHLPVLWRPTTTCGARSVTLRDTSPHIPAQRWCVHALLSPAGGLWCCPMLWPWRVWKQVSQDKREKKGNKDKIIVKSHKVANFPIRPWTEDPLKIATHCQNITTGVAQRFAWPWYVRISNASSFSALQSLLH